ncbi:MAG: GDP-mannose 4,6-dehydratase [Candidatus Uhrbacteria bacterium]|nr:GDP-mannose 4,6-dehydratase [Candidatus Uhrbacteria bacterium]
MKKALITGITGQDGFFLAQWLLGIGYEVHGFVRRNSAASLGNVSALSQDEQNRIVIHWGDVIDHTIVESVVREHQFDELYHLAAQSFVGASFTNPSLTYKTNIEGTLNFVNAIKEFSKHTKFYFAATSELYGKAQQTPQDEQTPFYPRSPYGVSKLAGFWTVKNYREAYHLFMSNGILFNHESEYRGKEFVTRKITQAVARISRGDREPLLIGNLDAKRDWGFAGDYVKGMWMILQHAFPDDFVLATGENHSVREFISEAFKVIGIDVAWSGEGTEEIGTNRATGNTIVQIDPQYFRPAEVDTILGNASKAEKLLGWRPTVTFTELVERMVKADMNQHA